MTTKRNEDRKLRGVCTICGTNKPPEGMLTCDPCRNRVNKYQKNRRVNGLLTGLCTICGKNRPPGGYKICQECRDYHSEDQSIRYADRKLNGLCVRCGQSSLSGYITCAKHQSSDRAMSMFYRKEMIRLHKCLDCAKDLPEDFGRIRCYDCTERARKRALEHRDKKFFNGFRKAALERDNHSCAICGNKEHRMHVHHLVENVKSVDDVVTLCIHCHTVITGFMSCHNKSSLVNVLIKLSSGLGSILAFQR